MIQDFLLRAIVFLIPTQFGYHFWPEFTRLAGIKIDYYSPTIYIADIFIVIYLLLNTRSLANQLRHNRKVCCVFLFFTSINLVFAINKYNTFHQCLRLVEYILLYLVLQKVPNLWKKISISFKVSLLLIVAVQLFQFIYQKSLDGAFYFLGERHFTGSTPNLPQIQINNHLFTRAPSIFSHPNSLAGYMALSVVILTKYSSDMILKVISLLSIAVSFSKSAIVATTFYFLKINLGKNIFILFTLFSLLQLLIPKLNTNIYSLDSRSTMISQFRKLSPKYLVYGAGLGNYPSVIKEVLPGSMNTISNFQPIHNILLLLIVELGVPLTLILLYLLRRNYSSKVYPIVIIILVSGLFDHYWLTLPQNKLILVLAIALFK